MTGQKKAYSYAAAAVLLWSTVASAFKISLRYMDYLHLLLFSSLVSTVALFIIIVMQGKLGLIRNLRRSDYVRFALMGLLNPFAYYVFLFKSYSLLPAQEAQPLNYTWPVILSLLSVPLLKQKMKRRSIAGIMISFAGVFIISTRGNPASFSFSNPAGALLALGSAVIWAVYWICNLKDGRDAVVKLFAIFVFGLIYISIYLSIRTALIMPPAEGLAGAAFVGLFEMGITFIVWIKALELSENTARVAGLIYLVPFLSLLLICLVVGEQILASSITGLCFVTGGILVQKTGN